MLEFDPRICCREAPVNLARRCVACFFPRTYLLSQPIIVRQTLSQTLAHEHAELNLDHVQPTAVLGRVVDVEPIGNPLRLGRREGLVERRDGVGVELIHHQHDCVGSGIVDIDQLLDAVCPIHSRAPRGHGDVPSAAQRLTDEEEIGDASSGVFGVVAGGLSRRARERFMHVTEQLGERLIQTDLREAGIIGARIDIKHVLYAGDKGRTLLGWDAPTLLQPWLERAFFNVRRTNSRETWRPSSTVTNSAARSRTLQRARPAGGALQARAIRCASSAPESVRGLVARGGRWRRAASRPSRTKRRRTRATVERSISSASAMAVSCHAGPSGPSSALRRMRAWLS